MAETVGNVMRSIRNFFETGYVKKPFAINGGAITPSNLFHVGEYIAIEGSYYHDGVWKIGEGYKLEDVPDMPDEEFHGRVWLLRPPISFINLCSDIAEYELQNPVGANKTESLGSYSYTRATADNGLAASWQSVFASQLNPYRRMFTEVRV